MTAIRPDREAMMVNIKNIAKEARNFARITAKRVECGRVNVESVSAGENKHAAVISHICEVVAGHEGSCKCWCGHRWFGPKSVPIVPITY